MAVSLRRARSGTPSPAPEAFRAPLFQDLVTQLGPTERHVVLDLGTASTGMLALLGRSRCRVEIADLAHFANLDQLNAMKPGAELARAVDAMLPAARPDNAFDLVFCWDLPNYLTLDALSAMMDAIGRRMRPGGHAHALIYYSRREMCERPGRFAPNELGELIDCNAAHATVAAPRYSPEDLDKSMSSFVLDRARLLSNGMQEFLFQNS